MFSEKQRYAVFGLDWTTLFYNIFVRVGLSLLCKILSLVDHGQVFGKNVSCTIIADKDQAGSSPKCMQVRDSAALLACAMTRTLL